MNKKDDGEKKINPNFQDLYIRDVMDSDHTTGIELLRLNRPSVFKMLDDLNKEQSGKSIQ